MTPPCVILGPTASGKSALAHAVARAVSGEVLQADSMTVYRGMDLGTAKPTPSERAEVVYHGLDLSDPDATFTVARWLEAAEQALADARRRGVPMVITGGTPLYYQALFRGLFEGPPADAGVRQRLATFSEVELHRRLSAVDPAAARRIHLNDRKRLTRALEVHELTGRPISDQQTQWAEGAGERLAAVRFGLHWDREALSRRINARAKAMLADGWLEEVRGLLARYGPLSSTAAEAAGYRLLTDHLAGRLSLEDALEQIKIKTRQLAKRQMTWFRRFDRVTWLPGDAPREELVAKLLDQWKAHSGSP